MQNQVSIQKRLDELKLEYGEFTYDIPLPFGIWTKGNLQLPHTRLKRIVQIISDLSKKPITECRVLDLGCLDGMFSIEFALLGATTVGVEIRTANIKKAIFCSEVLGLHNLVFRQDDVRNISPEAYGKFDAIICSGILYHLPAVDGINLIQTMYEMVDRVVVIDTHLALVPRERVSYGGETYWGSTYREFSDNATSSEVAKALWSSADNPTSFWFTRPSLVNIISKTGFSSVYECFTPAHLDFGRSDIAPKDRCTFVALKAEKCELKTSPSANNFHENWPEGSLTFAPEKPATFSRQVLTKLKRRFSYGSTK